VFLGVFVEVSVLWEVCVCGGGRGGCVCRCDCSYVGVRGIFVGVFVDVWACLDVFVDWVTFVACVCV
jgi:hypothetical protein